MKLGYEVEGRHKGLESFFIDKKELKKFSKKYEYFLKKYNKCRHLYITINKLKKKHIKKLNKLLNFYYITIETKDLSNIKSKDIKNFHIMLNINSVDIWKLKNTDSIKFHKNMVLSNSIESFLKTSPKEFKNDINIKL